MFSPRGKASGAFFVVQQDFALKFEYYYGPDTPLLFLAYPSGIGTIELDAKFIASPIVRVPAFAF